MPRPPRVLSTADTRRFYDRFGRKQDWQIYEARALDRLVRRGQLDEARAVLELGCGTGKLAERLLRENLPGDARYVAVDISDTMLALTAERLRPWVNRVEVRRGNACEGFPDGDALYDRFVCSFVLDLLPADAIARVLEEARRLLEPSGLLCLASLTHGKGPASRAVSRLWSWVAARRPVWVGGCRPIRLREFVTDAAWSVRYDDVVRSFGLCTEVLVATPR